MNQTKLTGWEKLACPYFAGTSRRVLSPYLETNGFVERGCNVIGGLLFFRSDVFLEISYELDTAPNYALSMVLGLGEEKYDQGGHPCGVPYWYLLPRGRPEHRGESIRFRSEADLEALLVGFKDRFLEPYAKPLWFDHGRLEKTIANFRVEFSC